MTAGGDFIPGDQGLDIEPEYPTIFGLSLTPLVSGVMLAIVGLAGAGALLFYLVLPEWERYQQLQGEVTAAETELEQQAAIAQQIAKAKANLETAKTQKAEVLKLFANENALDTLLLDLNRQIDARNANLPARKQQKLAQCPALVRENLGEFEKQAGPLAAKAELKKFEPVKLQAQGPQASPVITDGSYGPQVNNKLKREVVNVTFSGNFEQTTAILQSIERLQPLLVIRDLNSTLDDRSQKYIPLPGASACIPDPLINTTFKLEALLPLTPEELKQANPTPSPSPSP